MSKSKQMDILKEHSNKNIRCMNCKSVSVSMIVLMLVNIQRSSRDQRISKMWSNAPRPFQETGHNPLKKNIIEKQFSDMYANRDQTYRSDSLHPY